MSAFIRSEFTTADLDEACAVLSATYAATRLRVIGDGSGFRFSQVMHDLGAVRIDHLQHALATEAAGDPVGCAIICRVLDNVVEFDTGDGFRRFGPGDVFVCQRPDGGYRSVQAGATTQAVSIDLSLLGQVAGMAPGDAALLPDDCFGKPLAPSAARTWQHAVQYVSRHVLADETAATGPLLIDNARRLLTAAMLTVLDSRRSLPVDTRDATSRTVERAVAFIETNSDLRIGLADIARAAYVTPRAVQLAFRRHLGTTPTAYLRRVRLERAHDELADADPATGTVTAIAARWGFSGSRFASLYRETYHEAPSETLHR